MKIGKIIIRKSSDVRNILINNLSIGSSKEFVRVFQIYQCRIFGLCIYRKSIGTIKDDILEEFRNTGLKYQIEVIESLNLVSYNPKYKDFEDFIKLITKRD